MKLTEEEAKQIILDEMKKYLEEVELAKTLKNVGSLSLDTFKKFVDTLTQEISLVPVSAMDNYIELALELKETGWGMKYWESYSEDEKKLFLRTTYPSTPYHESFDMMEQSFTNPNIARLIYHDTLLAVEKANELKKEIKSGEYLGPQEPGGEPLSPHWKEYLEEVAKEKKQIKENFVKLLAENKSQKEIKKLLSEGFKDTARRLAMKYGLPAMAVLSMLTSGINPAQASELEAASKEAPTMVATGGEQEDSSAMEKQKYCCANGEPFKIVNSGEENYLLISCSEDSCNMLGKMSKAEFANKLESGEINRVVHEHLDIVQIIKEEITKYLK
tara:strand:- start:353 stop:1345 length:993 start_codon:yes stop_codon:yes gene_type:complete